MMNHEFNQFNIVIVEWKNWSPYICIYTIIYIYIYVYVHADCANSAVQKNITHVKCHILSHVLDQGYVKKKREEAYSGIRLRKMIVWQLFFSLLVVLSKSHPGVPIENWWVIKLSHDSHDSQHPENYWGGNDRSLNAIYSWENTHAISKCTPHLINNIIFDK